MKRIVILVLLLLLSSCATTIKIKPDIKRRAMTVAYNGPMRKVAVVDFQVKAAYGRARIGSTITDIVVSELFNTGRFIMIEREKVAKIIEEQMLGASGIVDSSTAVELGKILGAATIVTGSVSEFGVRTTGADYLIFANKKQSAEAVVDVRVVDVTTGRILYTGTGRGVASKRTGTFMGMGTSGGYDETLEGSAMRASIINIIDDMVDHISKEPWSCKVVEVDGDDIYLNAGQLSNIEIGMKLSVFREGKKIWGEDASFIGAVTNEIGTVEVKKHFGMDGSIAVLLSGQKPSAGDTCSIE